MSDFQFIQNPVTGNWTILDPRRSKRPNVGKGANPTCPFCIGEEKEEIELYRVGGEKGDSNWLIRVIENKFAFAPHHELIIHSPDHHKNFDELPQDQVLRVMETYRQRFNAHAQDGQVLLFNNHGAQGGESLPHPHTQLVVIPDSVPLNIPKRLEIDPGSSGVDGEAHKDTEFFSIFCPKSSQWPDEVWIVPQKRGTNFGEISDEEVSDFAFVLKRLIEIFDTRHGHEFPFNFFIHPGSDWYLRFVPIIITPGGFDIATNIFVNTQDPQETIQFIMEHFENPDHNKIREEYKAEFRKSV